MENYWLKQTTDKPLYPDLLWSKPINKSHAGTLSIIGGSASGFSATVNLYNEALKSGIGEVLVVLPESTKKIVGHVSSDIIFAPVNLSGSFAKNALSEILDTTILADTTILSGEIGNNSETTVMLESLFEKISGPLVIAGDSIDSMQSFLNEIRIKQDAILICDFNRLQKFSTHSGYTHPLTSTMQLSNFVDFLHDFTQGKALSIVTEHSDNIIIASGGKVSTTKSANIDLIKLSAQCGVWIAQNPSKIFEALNCAVI